MSFCGLCIVLIRNLKPDFWKFVRFLFLFQGKHLAMIEVTSQLYRSLAPIQPWISYLFDSYTGIQKLFGIFLSAMYMLCKGPDLIYKVKTLVRVFQKFLQSSVSIFWLHCFEVLLNTFFRRIPSFFFWPREVFDSRFLFWWVGVLLFATAEFIACLACKGIHCIASFDRKKLEIIYSHKRDISKLRSICLGNIIICHSDC